MFYIRSTTVLRNKICKIFKNCCDSSQILINHYRKLLAFTLAEVLITLLIIGIVASMVIPALIQDTQEAEYHVAYKKGLSTFSQAFMRMRMDNGGTLAGVFVSYNHENFQTKLSQYLNIAEYSPSSSVMPKPTWHNAGIYKKLNGQVENFLRCYDCPSARLQDGSFFLIWLSWASNNLNTCYAGGSAPRNDLCFNIVYDINGKNPPNTFGKDIYILAVYKNKVVPADWIDYGYGSIDESSCTSGGTGYGCAIKYAKE